MSYFVDRTDFRREVNYIACDAISPNGVFTAQSKCKFFCPDYSGNCIFVAWSGEYYVCIYKEGK